MITWSTTELCQDSDLTAIESTAINWTAPEGSAKKWRDRAKAVIERKLRRALKKEELAISGTEVLDLISNPEVLKDIACYYTLYALANDKMTNGHDYYAAKATHYLGMFNSEWAQAMSDICFDLDESGTISDSEKYTRKTGVRLHRGI